jgi:hypothetical protein
LTSASASGAEPRRQLKLFADFAADVITVIDPVTGKLRPVKFVIAHRGASKFCTSEAAVTNPAEG